MRNEEDAIDQIYEYAAHLMVNQKKSHSETKQALIEQGLDEAAAIIIVNNLAEEINKTKKSQASNDMFMGAVWCIGGILVTVVTFSNASGGGTYVVAWGAILFGAIQFLRGSANS